ncbi:MAG: hypothetical protein V4721_10630 [Bacteroidota bacterium]
MSGYKYEIITTKRSIPENINKTGTIATFGVAIVGTGTLFLTEMIAGSYLVDEAQDEVRRVIRVNSNTSAFLSKAFSSNIAAGATPSVIAKQFASPKEISIKIDSADLAGELNGVAFTGVLTISKSSSDRSSQWDTVPPVIVDGSGTSIKASILY